MRISRNSFFIKAEMKPEILFVFVLALDFSQFSGIHVGGFSVSTSQADEKIDKLTKEFVQIISSNFPRKKENFEPDEQNKTKRKRSLELDVVNLDDGREKDEPVCLACVAGVNLLQHYIEKGLKTSEIINNLYDLCVGTKFRSPTDCSDFTNLFGPEVVEILSNTTNTPREVCSFVFNTACGNGDVPNHRWSINFPPVPKPPLKPRIPPKSDTPKFKVLHLSDTHYDALYREGTKDVCDLPMCCRLSNGMAGPGESAAGKWGGWKCDIPERTLDSLLQHLKDTHSNFDYIIFTGDIPPHATWSQTIADSIMYLNSTISKLIRYFPNTPIFPALGNHESSPPHNFPPPSLEKQETISWLYEALVNEWSKFLPSSTYETIKHAGYYSVPVCPGLKLISLNTNFCYYNNWWLILNSTDPANMLNWFIKQVQESEDKDEKVHVIAHIPPGYFDCLKVWAQNYYKIISRYENTITAQFFGHTHTDEIELFYDTNNSSRPVGIGYVGPSASTFTYLNPGYRVYTIDGRHDESQYYVENFETWIMNLTDANLNDKPVWFKLFTAKEGYQLDSLLPEDWNSFYERLKTDENLMETYDRHYWKGSDKRPKCGSQCKKTRLCDIRSCIHYGDPTL